MRLVPKLLLNRLRKVSNELPQVLKVKLPLTGATNLKMLSPDWRFIVFDAPTVVPVVRLPHPIVPSTSRATEEQLVVNVAWVELMSVTFTDMVPAELDQNWPSPSAAMRAVFPVVEV
jgi:hypothetical protein